MSCKRSAWDDVDYADELLNAAAADLQAADQALSLSNSTFVQLQPMRLVHCKPFRMESANFSAEEPTAATCICVLTATSTACGHFVLRLDLLQHLRLTQARAVICMNPMPSLSSACQYSASHAGARQCSTAGQAHTHFCLPCTSSGHMAAAKLSQLHLMMLSVLFQPSTYGQTPSAKCCWLRRSTHDSAASKFVK